MSRRLAREVALQALYQLDMVPVSETSLDDRISEVIDEAVANGGQLSGKDKKYIFSVVKGTQENTEAIDSLITSVSKEWKIERMAAIDRNVTRIAAYEMKFAQEKLTPNIAINEAVEIAKKYGTDDSARFVNGILGAMVK